jgi:hypothetical protein
MPHRIASGVGRGTITSGAADCDRHDGRSTGFRTPSGGIKGTLRPEREAEQSHRITGGPAQPFTTGAGSFTAAHDLEHSFVRDGFIKQSLAERSGFTPERL